MEPTIYKPSIYKGAGIYKVGAEGGGSGINVIGGREYRTINIGGKTWLAENLDFKFVEIGIYGYPQTPAAWYYNNEPSYGLDGIYKCGLLYNWYAIKFLEDNKSELCPGWHVPTENEFDDMFTNIGGSSIAGKKLKALTDSIITGFPQSSWNGIDEYSFSALPAGTMYQGSFYDFSNNTIFWTISEKDANYAWSKSMNTGDSVNTDDSNKTRGFSLRLVKD